MSLFFVQQYIVAKASQLFSYWLKFRIQSTLHHNPNLTLHLLLVNLSHVMSWLYSRGNLML